MTAILSAFVRGLPVSQGSKRLVKLKRGRAAGQTRMIEVKGKELKEWRDDVKVAILAARMRLGGAWVDHRKGRPEPEKKRARRVAYKLTVVFVVPRPESDLLDAAPLATLVYRVPKGTAPKVPTRKPDIDKLVRAVADAVKETAWSDDCQVVRLEAFKFHGQGVAGAWIRIEEVDPLAFPPHLVSELQREGLAIVGVDVVERKRA